jgi:hypothetical protein
MTGPVSGKFRGRFRWPSVRGTSGTQGGTPEQDIVSGEHAGISDADLAAASRQRGRPMRGVVEVAHRCPCGEPDIVRTAPRLPDGTPFPTTYYATCPRLTGEVSTLETSGLMKAMEARLHADSRLAQAYRAAHDDYLARRAELGEAPEIAGVSAGGMPDRVKCLHVLIAHALARGPGVNPLGDEALALLEDWWVPTSCASAGQADDV